MAKKDLTVDRLRAVLAYDPCTGLFTWRVRKSHACRAGDVAGTLNAGYVLIGIDGTIYKAHRLVWRHVHGTWPPDGVDHLNGIRSDNRLANLRLATHAENLQNRRRAARNNSSGLIGVSAARARNRWAASIYANGKSVWLGYFKTPEEAHAVYVEAKRRLHSRGTL